MLCMVCTPVIKTIFKIISFLLLFYLYILLLSDKLRVKRIIDSQDTHLVKSFIVNRLTIKMKEKFASCNFQSDFKVIEELYRSHTGAVYKALFKYDQKIYVLKEKKLPELGRRKDIMNEVKLLEQLRHPNVVACEGWFRDLSRDTLFMVLEYCEGGDLNSLIERRKKTRSYYTEEEIWFIFGQICRGLRHLHEHGIIHRDLKALNVLTNNDQTVYKLADLGVSRQLSEQTMLVNTFYGTPLYLSPELIENKAYNEKTDIWSLGILLYELCMLRPPFQGNTLMALAKNVLKGEYDPIPSQYSKYLVKCIAWLLNKDYRKRPNIAQILELVEKRIGVSSFKGESLSPPRKEKDSKPRSGDSEEEDDDDDIEEDSLQGNNNDDDTLSESSDQEIVTKKANPSIKRPINLATTEAVMIPLPFPQIKPSDTFPPPPTSVPSTAPTSAPTSGPIIAPVIPLPIPSVSNIPNPPLELKSTTPPRPSTASRSKKKSPSKPPKKPIDTSNIIIQIDIPRAQVRLRKELVRYRKLLQTRDFMADHIADDVQEKLVQYKQNIGLLESAIDSGSMNQDDALRLQVLPFLPPEEPKKNEDNGPKPARIVDDTLPVYLQPPPLPLTKKPFNRNTHGLEAASPTHKVELKYAQMNGNGSIASPRQGNINSDKDNLHVRFQNVNPLMPQTNPEVGNNSRNRPQTASSASSSSSSRSQVSQPRRDLFQVNVHLDKQQSQSSTPFSPMKPLSDAANKPSVAPISSSAPSEIESSGLMLPSMEVKKSTNNLQDRVKRPQTAGVTNQNTNITNNPRPSSQQSDLVSDRKRLYFHQRHNTEITGPDEIDTRYHRPENKLHLQDLLVALPSSSDDHNNNNNQPMKPLEVFNPPKDQANNGSHPRRRVDKNIQLKQQSSFNIITNA